MGVVRLASGEDMRATLLPAGHQDRQGFDPDEQRKARVRNYRRARARFRAAVHNNRTDWLSWCPAIVCLVSIAVAAARVTADAVETWPESKGGWGSYSMTS